MTDEYAATLRTLAVFAGALLCYGTIVDTLAAIDQRQAHTIATCTAQVIRVHPTEWERSRGRITRDIPPTCEDRE